MATLKIERNAIDYWGEEQTAYLVRPKPTRLRGRIQVWVPDRVVLNRETQPVIDAYAEATKQLHLKGKTTAQLEKEHHLLLGFHVLSFDESLLNQEELPKFQS